MMGGLFGQIGETAATARASSEYRHISGKE
jgi:hypothetical protein